MDFVAGPPCGHNANNFRIKYMLFLFLHRACCYDYLFFIPTHAHFYTL